MRIFITTPCFGEHGGIYNIIEWANRLQEYGHQVTLYNQAGTTKYNRERTQITCSIATSAKSMHMYDCLIVCSPHGVDLLDNFHGKKFIYMQMCEHMFRENDRAWFEKCKKFYLYDCPVIHGSRWGEEYCRNLGRTGEMHYVGTGINFDHFPIWRGDKDGRTVLLESPEPSNPCKDVDRIALQVGEKLRMDGYNIIGYGALNPQVSYKHIFSEFHIKPSLQVMNELYERATILIKATKYDARAVAPLEAMTKGCVTVRGIVKGDDDLIDGENAVVCGYNEFEVYEQASLLLKHPAAIREMQQNCYDYIQLHNWKYWMDQVNQIISA